jgi:hypothetical protein
MNLPDLLQFQQPFRSSGRHHNDDLRENDYTSEKHSFSKDGRMLTSHGLLLKFWHDSRYVFPGVEVEFVDRGAPGDRSTVSGRDIRVLDAYYFEIVSEQGVKCIPYHRIRRLTYNGNIVWER